MTWSELSDNQKLIIQARRKEGESTDVLAREFGLNPESLARKFRLLGVSRRPSMFEYDFLHLTVETQCRVLVYSDTHFGVQDDTALRLAIVIAKEYHPEIIINLGDTLDCYELSKFRKDSINHSLQEERDLWAEWAETLNVVCPNARKYILKGNHDTRFESMLSTVDGFDDMPELTVDALLYTKELGYHPVVDAIYINSSGDSDFPDAQLYAFHGQKALKHAGATARAASDTYVGASTITGHAHRTALYTQRTGRGFVKAYEVGTLAKLSPEYNIFPNWSQSVATGVIANGYHDFQLHVMERGTVCFNGRTYRS